MSLTISTEHVETALGRILYQFKDKPKFEAFITAFVQQFQDIEDVIGQLLTDRQIDTATGENLNILGRIVGEERQGRVDADYRLWIKARIQINKSSGTAEEMINVLRLVTGLTDTGTFEIVEDNYPAYLSLTSHVALGSIDPTILYAILNEMRSACVSFNLTYALYDPIARYDVAGAGYDLGYFGETI